MLFSEALFENSELLNFNLQENSPCIDTGDPEILDPDGTTSDIGAIFFDQSGILGDCNDDGNLNILDVVSVVNECVLTGSNACLCADMNADEEINVLDIVILVSLIVSD